MRQGRLHEDVAVLLPVLVEQRDAVVLLDRRTGIAPLRPVEIAFEHEVRPRHLTEQACLRPDEHHVPVAAHLRRIVASVPLISELVASGSIEELCIDRGTEIFSYAVLPQPREVNEVE